MIRRKWFSLGGSLLVAALSLAALFGPAGSSDPVQAVHGGMDAMSIDVDTAGNNSGAVGSIEQCAQINKNNVKDSFEDVIDGVFVDVTAEGVPAYLDNGTPTPADDSGGIIGYAYTLNYPSLFTVQAQQATDSSVNLLAANNNDTADLFNGSEATPDNEESNYNVWTSALLDTGTDAPESGDGVLDRLTISVDSGLTTAGQFMISLSDAGHLDAVGTLHVPHATALANIAVGIGSAPACNALTTSLGYFHPSVPTRVLDTRTSPQGSPPGPADPGEIITVNVTNIGGGGSVVPASGVSAVVINTTVTGATAASHLTVFPSDASQAPNASNLNFTAGKTVPNLVTVKVGPDGKIKLRNFAGTTHVIIDVMGWYGGPTNGSQFHPIPPKRILDTRSAAEEPTAPIGWYPNGTPIPAGKVGPAGLPVDVTNTPGSPVPNSGVTAVVLNVTVTGPTAASDLTVYPSDASPPLASNLNFVAGQTVPNLVAVKVGTADGSGGSVKVRNFSGNTHVIFDVVGWYDTSPGEVFTPLSPTRLLDTRPTAEEPTAPIGKDPTGANIPAGKVGPGGILAVDVTDTYNSKVPNSVATAVILNVTVTGPTAPSDLTVFPSDASPPLASNLNFVAGQTVPNLVAVKVGTVDGSGGSVKVRNCCGSTHVIFDVMGYFAPVPPP